MTQQPHSSWAITVTLHNGNMRVGPLQPTATCKTKPSDCPKKSPIEYSKKPLEIQDAREWSSNDIVRQDESVMTSSDCCSTRSNTVHESKGERSMSTGEKVTIKKAAAQSASEQLEDFWTVLPIKQEFMEQQSRREGITNMGHLLETPAQLDFKGYGNSDRGEDFNQDHDGASSKLSMYHQLNATTQSTSQHDTNHKTKPHILVKILAECPTLSSSLQDLMNLRNLAPSSVRKVVFKYPNTFCLKGEEVELKPEVRICEAHCGANGCLKRKSCCGLHICRDYVMDTCYNFGCVFGHKFNTGHNSSILRNLLINNLSSQILQKLLRANKLISLSNDLIGVCHDYNKNICGNYKCTSLHICLTFIVGLAKGNISACKDSCFLSHNLMNSGCLQLLKRYGLPTNETPRDIVHSLVSANPSLFHEGKGNIKCNAAQDTKINNTLPNDANSCERRGTKRKENSLEIDSDGVQTIAINNPPLTIWSHYLKGDVHIAEICYNSVENTCSCEGHGCQRLHASLHFHWQVSEDDKQWFNLRPAQVECLERAFCDPSKVFETLPRLDPSSLSHSLNSLFILMGRNTWSSNFVNMTLANEAQNKFLHIRRLCTERVEGTKVKPSTFLWYFCDHNNIWVRYGHPDTDVDVSLIVNATSEQIEKHFLQDPHTNMVFSSSKFTYTLSFQQMYQNNYITGAFRRVRRRPAPHLHCQGMEDLPQTWEVMLTKQRVQHVQLLDTSTEFKKILDLIHKNCTFRYNQIKIEKIQNPCLWRAFQSKLKEMTAIYGSLDAVDLRYLFHGTSRGIVKNITEQNFDWRLHGAANGRAFGQGTYFTTNASYAYGYTRPDATGCRFMFVANVVVGSKIIGNSSMSRPPLIPNRPLPFNSTVDNLQNPAIIVKYNKQEYYPEYLVMIW